MNSSRIIPDWLPRWAQGELELREVSAGTLVLTSGKIVACDPFVSLEGARALAQTVKPGKYKVTIGTGGEVAIACLKISRAKVATWELALAGEAHEGFAVDSGSGCFVDAEAAAKYAAEERARDKRIAANLVRAGVNPADAAAWHEAFERAQAEGGEDALGALSAALAKKQFASVELDEESGANLVAYKCGAGDGTYACYWGLDAKGKPALLVTDLAVAVDAEDRDEEGEEEELVDDERDEEDDLEDDDDDLSWDDDEPPVRVEKPPAASPLLPRARQILTVWEKSEKMLLEEDCDREALAEALLERLVSLEGHRHLGSHLAEWLMERTEVADVFATDEELEADIRKIARSG